MRTSLLAAVLTVAFWLPDLEGGTIQLQKKLKNRELTLAELVEVRRKDLDGNSASRFAKAVDAMEQEPYGALLRFMPEQLLGFRPSRFSVWVMCQHLERNSEAISFAQAGAKLRTGAYGVRVRNGELPRVEMPVRQLEWMSDSRDLYRLLEAQAAYHAAEQSGEGGADNQKMLRDDLLLISRFCSSFGRPMLALEYSIGNAYRRAFVDTVERMLSVTQVDVSTLESTREEMKFLRNSQPPDFVFYAMGAEKIALLNYRQTSATSEGDEPDWEALEKSLDIIIEATEIAEVPFEKRWGQVKALWARVSKNHPDGRVNATGQVVRDLFWDQVGAETALLLGEVAAAVELYRRRQGHWPESLEDLVPKYFEQVPVGPLGEEIGFKIIDIPRVISGCVISFRDGPAVRGPKRRTPGVRENENRELWPESFVLLDPRDRGAHQRSSDEDILNSGVTWHDCERAGLSEQKLNDLGVSDWAIERLGEQEQPWMMVPPGLPPAR